MISVAILDDGINDKYLNCPVEHYSVLQENTEDGVGELLSHGTICAKIIENYGFVDKIYDIRCLNNNGEGDVYSLVRAINKCEQLNATLVNISNGIETFVRNSREYQSLLNACNSLGQKSVMIFAAQSNYDAITIPADFSFVISVEELLPLHNLRSRVYRQSDYYVKEVPKLRIGDKTIKIEACNSYACAYLCGISSLSANKHDKKALSIKFFKLLIKGRILTLLRSRLFIYRNPRISSLSFFDCISDVENNSKYKVFEKRISLVQKVFYSMKHILYWSPESYRSSFERINPMDISLPIVYIYGNAKESEKFLLCSELQTVFVDNGYSADIITDSPRAIFYCAHYVEASVDGKMLANYCSISKADIILNVSVGTFLKDFGDDLALEMDNQMVKLSGKSLSRKLPCSDISNIYQAITCYYC